MYPMPSVLEAKIWVCFLRKFGIKSPAWLDEDDLRDFVRLRLKGELCVPFVTLRTTVKSRTVQADCVFLVSVLNCGAGAKDPERPQRKLLPKNELRVPGGLDNKNPDISFEPEPYMPYGHVKKNAHVDKEGCGDAVPLSLRARAIIRGIFRTRGISCGDREWFFPAPQNSSKPWSRWHVRDLMNRAEKAAAVAHLGGSHSIRRKWASERKGHPLVDVMTAGGWSDERSLRSYMQDDAETTYEVVSQPTRRIRRPKGRNGNSKEG